MMRKMLAHPGHLICARTAAALLLAGACAHTSDGLPGPEPEILSYDPEVESQTLTEVHLRFPWELRNPTKWLATVTRIRWTLTIEGETEYTGDLTPDVQAKASESASDALTVQAQLTNASSLTEQRDSIAIKYNLVARYEVTAAGLTHRFVAEWHGEVFAPQPPQLKVSTQASRYQNIVDLMVTVGIFNPNPFPLDCAGLDFVFAVDGVEVSRGTLAPPPHLRPATDHEVEISRQLGPKDLPDLARRLHRRGSFPYRLDSVLKLAGQSLTGKSEGEITFSR